MRIATLQLSPRIGDVEGNIRRANTLLSILEKKLERLNGGTGAEWGGGADADSARGLLDVLVLPEMAFSGYNFPSLKAIEPYLEPTESGPSSRWARDTARRLGCAVCVGYPELAEAKEGPPPGSSLSATSLPTKKHNEPQQNGYVGYDKNETETKPTIGDDTVDLSSSNGATKTIEQEEEKINENNTSSNSTAPIRFNSALLVSPTGTTLYNYQKRFLYYTDEPWASEGRNGKGFFHLPLSSSTASTTTASNHTSSPTASAAVTIPTAIGICMDINPYKFQAPWHLCEFATHVLSSGAKLVLLPMAWLTLLSPLELELLADRPDLDTFKYWIMRFLPVIERGCVNGEGEGNWGDGIIIVFANRVGEERDGFRIGGEGDGVARYAGSSCVVGVRRKDRGWGTELEGAEIVVWEMLGRGEEGVCFVDTEREPKMVFRVGGRGRGDEGEDGDESS
ncbi:hypothetical protein AJ79_00599 [Helicocarpus griseus UAMH5409]|uniref:CN hydrolase domain-containing protein n=1 Tax=Helicocarpus griseus UAMH5409 TaxID=1447875 RepID=A0A2B7YAP4_9EURO|nr:hypothetical protein AJ79_00599 [Helicocarpus griseus UAMH5409]